jgi:hypothetical protein
MTQYESMVESIEDQRRVIKSRMGEIIEDQRRAIAKSRIELQEWSTRMEASVVAWHEVQAVMIHQQYLAEEVWYSYHYNNNCNKNGQANTNKSTHDDEEASGNDATTPDNMEEMMPSSTEAIGMLGCDYYQDDMCHTTLPTCLPPTVWRGGTTKTTTPKKAVRKKCCGNVKAVNPKKVIRKKSDRHNTETPTPTTTRPPQWFINIVLQQIVASIRVPTPVPPPPTTTTTTMMGWKGGSDKFVIPKKSVRKKSLLFDSMIQPSRPRPL